MGGRLLSGTWSSPLDKGEIIRRQDAVAALVDDAALRLEMQRSLDQVYDSERLMAVWQLNGRRPGPAGPVAPHLIIPPLERAVRAPNRALSSLEQQLDP